MSSVTRVTVLAVMPNAQNIGINITLSPVCCLYIVSKYNELFINAVHRYCDLTTEVARCPFERKWTVSYKKLYRQPLGC